MPTHHFLVSINVNGFDWSNCVFGTEIFNTSIVLKSELEFWYWLSLNLLKICTENYQKMIKLKKFHEFCFTYFNMLNFASLCVPHQTLYVSSCQLVLIWHIPQIFSGWPPGFLFFVTYKYVRYLYSLIFIDFYGVHRVYVLIFSFLWDLLIYFSHSIQIYEFLWCTYMIFMVYIVCTFWFLAFYGIFRLFSHYVQIYMYFWYVFDNFSS